MDLLNRLSHVIRAAANDLLSREEPAPQDRAAQLLKTAQQRANKLNEQLAQAVAREQRAEQDWREFRAGVDALEAEVDMAVRNHQDEAARARLSQLNLSQNKLQQLSDRWKSYAASSEKLRMEIQDLHAQLAEAQRRLQQANKQQSSTDRVENPQQAVQKPQAEPTQAQDALKTREEQAAQHQDNAPPRDELDETRIADLLKKRDK